MMPRLLLIVLLLNGLVPAIGDAAIEAVHLAWAGVGAHPVPDCAGECDGDCDRGCRSTQEHCICCPGLTFVALPPTGESVPAWRVLDVPVAATVSPATRSLEPPYRLPIA
jgi:hypothetical protein